MTSSTDDTGTAPVYVPAGEGKAFWGPGDRYTFLITGNDTNGSCFILEALVPPTGGPPPHIHHREDEYFYLLHGTLTVVVDGKAITAKAGDFVHVKRGVVHSFRNDGQEIARLLAIFTPAGMEHWFEECLEPAPDKTSMPPPPTTELIQRMIAAGPKHGVEWKG
jgi:quercetin dioxygenase-like cupin family protein